MFNRRNLIIGACIIGIALIWLIIPKNKKESPIQSATASTTTTTSAVPDQTAQQMFEEALDLSQDRQLVQAKEAYKRIITEHPDFERIELIENELEKLNMEIIFSNSPSADAVMHEVVSGDTLGELAKKYGTTIDLIKINNGLKSDVIRLGRTLRIWNAPFNIHVDKSQNILMLKKGDEVVKVYNVSTGEGNSTPVGTFKVTSRLTDPVWFNKGVVVPPESPENVLGSRWLGFDIPGYGIHGTIEPETIGQQVTAGCVRMRNEEVEELYSIIPNGTMVSVVD